MPPLHVAAECCRFKIVDYLLDEGADVYIQNPNEEIIFHHSTPIPVIWLGLSQPHSQAGVTVNVILKSQWL